MIYLAAGMNLLNVEPGLLIWTLVTFLIVVFILRKFAWNPIIEALDLRAEKIHGDLDKAEKAKADAESLLADYKHKINSAKDEALKIVNEANSDATNLKNKMLQETQNEMKKMKEQTQRDIELSKLKAIQELQEHVVGLSISIASQILEKKLSVDEHSTFIKSEVAKLGKVRV